MLSVYVNMWVILLLALVLGDGYWVSPAGRQGMQPSAPAVQATCASQAI